MIGLDGRDDVSVVVVVIIRVVAVMHVIIDLALIARTWFDFDMMH